MIDQDDIDSFLELIDDIGLQVFVERHECLTGTTPGGMNIDDDHFGISLIEVVHEVVRISDDCGQLRLLGRHIYV